MSTPFDTGYSRLFTIKRIPVEAHWSIILLMILVGGGLHFTPGAWLGAFLLVLIHELGHATVARVHGLHVQRIQMHGLGGVCFYSGYPTSFQDAQIAWGGVLGQAALYAVTVSFGALFGPPRTDFTYQLVDVFTEVNLVVACVNLLPVAPLDGYRAWKLVPQLSERLQRDLRRWRTRRKATGETRGRR